MTHQGGRGHGLLDGRVGGQDQLQGGIPVVAQSGAQQGFGDNQGSGGRVELPSLPEKLNPMELGDWLCLIGPIMRDISVNSGQWWKLTMESAQAYYDEWRHSTPVQRVRINPTLPPELCTSQFIRTEQRGMGLLLRSLTEDIRKVVLANRDLTSTHIIWRLLITYQPGGSGEKGQLLSTLTTMPPVTSAGDLATLIRHWRRSFQRAQEIGTSLPDGTLLIKSLEQATKYLGQLDSQTAFRLAQSRAELGVDAHPIWQYSQVILAEAETLRLSNAVEGTSGSGAKIKALQTTSTTTGTSLKVCKHWGSELGCRFTKNCRCWLCSSSKHRKNECPYRGEGQLPAAIGGSDTSGKGKGKSKGGSKDGNGKDPHLKRQQVGDKGGSAGKSATTTSTTTETSTAGGGKSDDMVEPPKQEVMGEKSTSSTSTAAATGETLMGEVAGLLRSLRLQADRPPSIKACQLRKVQAGELRSCLLDGGATHCLRQFRTEAEWCESSEVSVALAQGDVMMRQHRETGTLLTREAVQPIVPLSQVAALGYQVHWTAQQCSIRHPVQGALEVTMEQGCPTVPIKVGMELMGQVEKLQNKFKVMRMVMEGGPDDGSEEQRRWKELRQLFPEVPVSLLQRVPSRVAWRSENLPFNRHVRRRLSKAKYVVVHVFSGPDNGYWRALETKDVAVLPLDLLQGADLLDSDLGGFLEDLTMQGKVHLWLAGPPCRSVSVSRHQDDGGPPPVRGRHEDRFGLPGLSPFEETLVSGDSVLWLKNLWWMWLARRHQAQVQFLLEQPQDPWEWKDQEEEYPSFTVWPETEEVMRQLELHRTRVHQGALGHSTMKPTVFITDLPEVRALDGLQVAEDFQSAPWPKEVKERIQFSRSLAGWAPGLKQLIGEIIKQRVPQDPKLHRLTKAEKDTIAGWQAHFDCGHLPFRHDCSICLRSAGKDRPRKKKEHRSSFCMSVDIAGPFQPGLDQVFGASPRYFMVANVAIPVDAEGPMVKGLQDLGFRLCPRDPQDANQEEVEVECPEGEDPMAAQVEEDDEDAAEAEVVPQHEAEQRWKEFIASDNGVESRVLSFAVPLVSRKAHHVVEMISWIYARVRSMDIPILRLHTDRAREFASSSFAKWCSNKSILHTMSPGDEPTQNARVERTIGLLKNRVRTLIKASGAAISWWPLALRHAAESMLRSQLWQLGIATPTIWCSSCSQVQNLASSRSSLEVSWHCRSHLGPGMRYECYFWRGGGARL